MRMGQYLPMFPRTALVTGGASGIVAMADELGADDRLVAFMQYLRVLVVVLLTPLLIPILFPGHHGGSVPGQTTFGDAKGWLLTIGVAAARVARRVVIGRRSRARPAGR